MIPRLRVAVALLAVSPFVFASCGDDPPTDQEFVAQLCGAVEQLRVELTDAIKQGSAETDATKAVERLLPPVEKFVDAFGDADAPDDLESWHDAAAKELEASLAAFKREKTLAALRNFGDSPIPDPPAETKQRLRELASGTPECDGVVLLKPG